MTDEKELTPLSDKHRRVLDEYLLCWHQGKAYQKAYPKALWTSCKVSATKLFNDPSFRAHLVARLEEVHMSADEALKRLADIARGDIADVLDDDLDKLDAEKAKKNDKTKLIKSLTRKTTITSGPKTTTQTHSHKVEMYSALDAIEKVLRVHGKFNDHVDVTSDGKQIGQPIDDERFDRAISTLADALRESISGKSAKPNSDVDTSK